MIYFLFLLLPISCFANFTPLSPWQPCEATVWVDENGKFYVKIYNDMDSYTFPYNFHFYEGNLQHSEFCICEIGDED